MIEGFMSKVLKVLIVEDSEDDSELMLLELRRGGFVPRCQRVTSAEEMLAALKESAWEIILSDYSLPGFDAFTALQMLRSRLDLPFVVVSGAISEEVAVELMRAGASDYVFKGNLSRLPAAVERELRESESRRIRQLAELSARQLAAVVQSSHEPIVSSTLDGIVTSWNPAAERFFGWTAQEVIGKKFSFYVPTDRLDESNGLLDQVRSGAPIERYETTRLHKGGAQSDVSVTISPVRDQEGRPVGVSEILHDISERKQADAALRQSEQRYRILADSLPQLVWTTDADGRAEYANARWNAYTGTGSGGPYTWNSPELIHPDDVRVTWRQWADSLETGEPFDLEYRLLRADGAYRWHVARGLPLRNLAGQITHWTGTCTDIHAQKTSESALRESEERLQHMVANAPFPAMVHAEDGQLILLSNAWTELTGYTMADLPTVQAWLDKAYGKEAAAQRARIDNIFNNTGRYHVGEFLIMTCAEGTLIWDFWATPLGRLPDGRRFVLSMAVDLTLRKQVQEALQLHDRAIQAVTQGIIITDSKQPSNPIVYVSPGFERLTGYSLAECVGRNCRFLQGKDTDPTAIARLREAVRTGEPCTVELLNYRKDETSFWNELSISGVRDADQRLTHFVGVQTDVTQRRRLEELFRQSQKMEAFGQLAGGIAHDFNNLLTIILGYSDVMFDMLSGDHPCHEPLHEIKRAAERSALLTHQLLAFGRKQIMDPVVLDLNEIVVDAEKMLRRVLGEDVDLIMVLSPELRHIRADPGQLEQVMVNLLVNARDAMPQGGELLIETKNVELDENFAKPQAGIRSRSHVLLAITDSGEGMPEEIRSKVFEPFFSTKDPGKGTGLGLSVVHGIIKQSDGQIEVQSKLGVGTTFNIYLPAVDQPARRAMPSLPANGAAPRGTETILLVEDDDSVRLIGECVLRRCGYRVMSACDATEAIRVSRAHDGAIDLLLTDFVMPKMNGGKLAELLHSERPKMRVLFMSGYTDAAIERQGVPNDGVRLVSKPFSPASLAEKVRACLDESAVAPLVCLISAPTIDWPLTGVVQ
jgi:PAS domain S-box-containing protein